MTSKRKTGIVYTKLPVECEEIAFKMRTDDVAPFAEIGRRLDCTPKTARNLYYRALRRRSDPGKTTKNSFGVKIIGDMHQESELAREFLASLRGKFDALGDKITTPGGIALAHAIVSASKGVLAGLKDMARVAGVEAPRKIDLTMENRRNAEFQEQLASNLNLALTLVLEKYHGPEEAIRISEEVMAKLVEIDRMSTGTTPREVLAAIDVEATPAQEEGHEPPQ